MFEAVAKLMLGKLKRNFMPWRKSVGIVFSMGDSPR